MIDKKKKGKPVTQHWPEMISVFFDFCREKFSTKPSFDGSAPRDLKTILTALQQRSEEHQIDWSLKNSSAILALFLNEAFKDNWIKQNFMLHILNRQKDKIIFKINFNEYERGKETITRGQVGGNINVATAEGRETNHKGTFGEL